MHQMTPDVNSNMECSLPGSLAKRYVQVCTPTVHGVGLTDMWALNLNLDKPPRKTRHDDAATCNTE